MKKHKHEWRKTGVEFYSCPGQYEVKCKCGKTKRMEHPGGIPTITLNDDEFKVFYSKWFP